MASEERINPLSNNNTGGLIRQTDHQCELTNREFGETSDCKNEIIASGDSLNGMRAEQECLWEIALGVKMIFCWCPPGEFLMGSPETELRFPDENQVHVIITRGFWMAKTQVTQAQWQAVMGNNPSEFRGHNLPVDSVSWNDAQLFLNKLNLIVCKTDGRQMVLPTEAQWEYACRAGEKDPFSGGEIDEVAWYCDNSGGKSHPVGTKKFNAWGLHDMHGNVSEWCSDRYAQTRLGGSDPVGPSEGSCRVVRGGGWCSDAFGCRAAYRGNYGGQGYKHYGWGFRVCRVSIP
jgi:formylglycine-generating enzyme required for sulfatase activity